MYRFYVVVLVLCFILLPGSLIAKEHGKGMGEEDRQVRSERGPSPNESAYEHASDNARFNRGDDGEAPGRSGRERDDDGEMKERKKDKQRDKNKQRDETGETDGSGKKQKEKANKKQKRDDVEKDGKVERQHDREKKHDREKTHDREKRSHENKQHKQNKQKTNHKQSKGKR